MVKEIDLTRHLIHTNPEPKSSPPTSRGNNDISLDVFTTVVHALHGNGFINDEALNRFFGRKLGSYIGETSVSDFATKVNMSETAIRDIISGKGIGLFTAFAMTTKLGREETDKFASLEALMKELFDKE